MGYHAPLLSGRRPNRVIDIACFDSKLQQARNTCERKQAKRRDWNVCRAMCQGTAFILVTWVPQIMRRQQKSNVLHKQGTLSETNYQIIFKIFPLESNCPRGTRHECFSSGPQVPVTAFLFGRGSNRVIDTACFDAKVQQARNTC